MGFIEGLLGLGLGLFGFGFYYKLEDTILDTHFTKYIIPGRFYDGSDLIWQLLPWICIILGAIIIVSAGIAYNNGGRGN